jgi:hypothetical protein
VNLLLWTILIIRGKTRSQNGVTLNDTIPCANESRHIQRLAQAATKLLKINAGVRRSQAVKEHALLHGRKSINRFLRHSNYLRLEVETIGFL